MGERSNALADRFEKAVAELIETVDKCSGEQWKAVCGDEKWSVAATAHHVGAQWPLEREYLDAAAKGGPAPSHTWDDINKKNAQHAEGYSAASKVDVVALLRDGSAPIASWVRGLSDEQLDKTMALPLADGASVSTAQLIEGGVLIDHVTAHLKSIRAAG
jgi:hypothetical protein